MTVAWGGICYFAILCANNERGVLKCVTKRDTNMYKANQMGFRHIAFEVEDIEGIVQSLKGKGIKFIGPIHTYPRTGKRLVLFWGTDSIFIRIGSVLNK